MGNKGEQEMVMDSVEASLRYPMDFTYHIQNFSAIAYNKVVKGKQQATVAYSFVPADAFAGRPIGLVINLQYRDAGGNMFIDPVFNETVQIVEFDEGFDTETFFMYVTMVGTIVLLLFLGVNLLSGGNKKKASPRSRAAVETGAGKDETWTTSGFRSPLCALPPAARPRPDSAREPVLLVLTRTDLTCSTTDDHLQLRPPDQLAPPLEESYTISFASCCSSLCARSPVHLDLAERRAFRCAAASATASPPPAWVCALSTGPCSLLGQAPRCWAIICASV